MGKDRDPTATQLSAHLPTAQSVSLTPQRSQICWRSFSDCKNQHKAAPKRSLSVRQASARVTAHLCCFPAEQEAPHRSLPGVCHFRNPPVKPVAPGGGMKNLSIASINHSVNVNFLDGVLDVYFSRLGSKAREEQHGMVSSFPLSQLTSLHVCTNIQEKGCIPTHLWY